MKKKEYKFILILTLIIMAISSLPYIIGNVITPEDSLFIGIIPSGSSMDFFSYLSWIRQGIEGRKLFEFTYTTEKAKRLIFHPLFLLLGWIGSITNIEPGALYHLFRLLLMPILFIILYKFIAIFFKNTFYRKIVFILCLLGSGFGGFYILANHLLSLIMRTDSTGIINTAQYLMTQPIDIWVSEHSIFWISQSYLIMEVALILLVSSFTCILNGVKKMSYTKIIVANILAFFLVLIHPYDIITYISLSFIWYLFNFSFPELFIDKYYYLDLSPVNIRKGRFFISLLHEKRIFLLKSSLLFLISLVGLGYIAFITMADPVAKAFSMIASDPTPSFYYIFLGFGFGIPLSFFSMYHILLKKNYSFIFPIFWFIDTLFLIYFPFKIQRKLILGFSIPISILSGYAIKQFVKFFIVYIRKKMLWNITINKIDISKSEISIFIKKKVKTIVNVYLILSAFSILVIMESDIAHIIENNTEVYYIKKKFVNGLEYLRNNSFHYKENVLSSYTAGVFIPAFSAQKVYAGHWDQTLNLDRKKREINLFWNEWDNKKRKKFLKNNNISFVISSYLDGEIKGFEKNNNFIRPIFENNAIKIYRIIIINE